MSTVMSGTGITYGNGNVKINNLTDNPYKYRGGAYPSNYGVAGYYSAISFVPQRAGYVQIYQTTNTNFVKKFYKYLSSNYTDSYGVARTNVYVVPYFFGNVKYLPPDPSNPNGNASIYGATTMTLGGSGGSYHSIAVFQLDNYGRPTEPIASITSSTTLTNSGTCGWVVSSPISVPAGWYYVAYTALNDDSASSSFAPNFVSSSYPASGVAYRVGGKGPTYITGLNGYGGSTYGQSATFMVVSNQIGQGAAWFNSSNNTIVWERLNYTYTTTEMNATITGAVSRVYPYAFRYSSNSFGEPWLWIITDVP